MDPVGAAVVLGLVFLIWLSTLSFLVWKDRSYLRQLFPKSDSRDIRNKFREVIEAILEFEKRGQAVEKHLKQVNKDGLYHIQKVAVLRYNPYNDTGGDQSFSVGLLDGNLNGLILTSLHSRAGTRIYVKSITKGESDLRLSKEESEVLKKVVNS